MSGSGICTTRATKKGQPFRNSATWKRSLALADEMVRAVGRGDVADDVGDRAHAMHVDRGRLGELGIALHEDADLALVAHRLLRGRDRLRRGRA